MNWMRRGACVLALASALLLATDAQAAASGWVFVDTNGNGVRDGREEGMAGIAVSNGREVAVTDAQGRYALPERDDFIFLTRPDGFACAQWYRRSGGEFALTPSTAGHEFFFIQVSDAHVYDNTADFAEFSAPIVPWYIPQFVADWLTLRFLRRTYGDAHPEGVMEPFRSALAPTYRGGDLADLGDRQVLQAYRAEFARPGSALGRVREAARSAFEEVAGLKPRFIISTGDLVLESDRGTPEAIDRWFRFYREISEAAGIPVYNTIGNNEIAGIRNREFSADDPRYGKHFFKEFYGPTYYSFDHGPFHFVALDTHRPDPRPDDPKWWDFGDMDRDTRAWVDADLTAHSGRVLVVLNHEPFHSDPAWGFEEAQTASDGGLLQKHGVTYALSGHVHLNSFMPLGETTHITTGALSGSRWVLPPSLHERGYRLFYARDRQLYSAWKPAGRPVIALTEPNSGDPGALIVAVVDRAGPFENIEVSLEGNPLPIERWGELFVRIQLDPSRIWPGGPDLRVRATRADGTFYEVPLRSTP